MCRAWRTGPVLDLILPCLLRALSDGLMRNVQEKSEHDAIQFERGDREMRVKLVLTELRQLARAMRRRHKEKDRPSGPPSTANTPVPPRPLVLSRNNSLQSPPYGGATATAAAAAPSFYSALLTHPLFASELDTIVPVLYLRARNASPASSGLTDEEDEEGAEGLGGGGGGGGGGRGDGADDDSPMRRFELPPDVDADSDERIEIDFLENPKLDRLMELLEQMKGRLKAENKPHCGAVIRIELTPC